MRFAWACCRWCRQEMSSLEFNLITGLVVLVVAAFVFVS